MWLTSKEFFMVGVIGFESYDARILRHLNEAGSHPFSTLAR